MSQATNQEAPRLQLFQERLAVLKRNRENVPLSLLKSKYRKAYDCLCAELNELTSAYVMGISMKNLRFRSELYQEAKAIIEKAIEDSEIPKECSKAVFKYQDLVEVNRLAEKLRDEILAALQPFYERHFCLYLLPECLEEPYPPPYIYNDVTGYFYIDGQWIDCPDIADGTLLFIRDKDAATTLHQNASECFKHIE